MSGLFIVALVMRKDTPGDTAIKPVLSWRWADSKDAALGSVIKWAQESQKDWAVASHIVTEMPPEHLAYAVEQHNRPAAG